MMPLIALHGFLGRPGFWDRFHEELDVYYEFQFYTPDLYDPRFFLQPNWTDWPKQFKEWLDYEEIEPPFILMGYSMGGRLALEYAQRTYGEVANLILVSTRPTALEGETLRDRRQWESEWVERINQDPIDKWWPQWNQLEVFGGDRRSLSAPADLTPDQMVASMQGWSITGQSTNWSDLVNIEAPQLWCFGQNDRKYASYAPLVANSVPTAKVFEIENAGHRIPIENPQGLAYRVTEFMGFPTK